MAEPGPEGKWALKAPKAQGVSSSSRKPSLALSQLASRPLALRAAPFVGNIFNADSRYGWVGASRDLK